MNRHLILVLLVGAVAAAATIWMTYPQPQQVIKDPTKYKFMHCPKCGKEFKFDLDQFAKGCPKCGNSDVVPTELPISVTGRQPSPLFNMVAWLMVDLIAVMGGILFVTRRRGEKVEDYVYMRCDKCRQRIRYREMQIGHTAQCPRCKRPFVYPEVDGEE